MKKETSQPPMLPVWWDARAIANKYNPERGVFPIATRIKDRRWDTARERLSIALGVPLEHIELVVSEDQADEAEPKVPEMSAEERWKAFPWPIPIAVDEPVAHVRKRKTKKGNKRSRG